MTLQISIKMCYILLQNFKKVEIPYYYIYCSTITSESEQMSHSNVLTSQQEKNHKIENILFTKESRCDIVCMCMYI